MFESYDQDIGMLTNKVSKKLTSYLNNKLEKNLILQPSNGQYY